MCIFFIVIFYKIFITTHTPTFIFLPKLVSSIAQKRVKTIVHTIVNIKYYRRDVYADDSLEYNPKFHGYTVFERKKIVRLKWFSFDISLYVCNINVNHRRSNIFLSPDTINHRLCTKKAQELLLKISERFLNSLMYVNKFILSIHL